jgi:hypothetical protein
MLFVFLITVCVLAACGLLLTAREKVVKTTGMLLLIAVLLAVLWLWRLSEAGAARTVMQALSLDDSELLLVLFLFVSVCVAVAWIWFWVSLRRQQQEQDALLSSVGRPSEPPNEPLQLDRQQQPRPSGDV